MQIINWHLSASLILYAYLFSVHCFYVYCGYEKRSISEVVKDFNNNIVLVKWYLKYNLICGSRHFGKLVRRPFRSFPSNFIFFWGGGGSTVRRVLRPARPYWKAPLKEWRLIYRTRSKLKCTKNHIPGNAIGNAERNMTDQSWTLRNNKKWNLTKRKAENISK
jgi:hypothetical protein